MNRSKVLGFAVVVVMSGATSVWAQSAPGAPGTKDVIPEKKAPPIAVPNSASTADGTLSDKLSTSNGVIAPSTNVDPGMNKPAPVPNPGSTPVIKPPTDGVQPK